jgi:tetratricopeptide (TPR) repeat protein
MLRAAAESVTSRSIVRSTSIEAQGSFMLRQLLTRSAANGGSIALALLVFTLAPDSARADQKPGRAQPPANALEDEPAYQRAVEQGLHEYQLGNFSEAKAFFARAHELSPNARTLRGLGMSAYELRDYVEAIAYFEQALDATERPLTPPMREEVVRLLGQARSFITRLTLSLRPSTTEVRVARAPGCCGRDPARPRRARAVVCRSEPRLSHAQPADRWR